MLYDNELAALSELIASSSPELQKALRLGIAALTEKEERDNPKLLTREELEKMNGKPVFIHDLIDGDGTWIRITFSSDTGLFYAASIKNSVYLWSQMGVTWNAYHYEPKRCPECSTYYSDHNTFPRICSYCGTDIDKNDDE